MPQNWRISTGKVCPNPCSLQYLGLQELFPPALSFEGTVCKSLGPRLQKRQVDLQTFSQWAGAQSAPSIAARLIWVCSLSEAAKGRCCSRPLNDWPPSSPQAESQNGPKVTLHLNRGMMLAFPGTSRALLQPFRRRRAIPRLTSRRFLGFPGGSVVNNPPAYAGDKWNLISDLGRAHVPQSNQMRVPQLTELCSRARNHNY